MSMALGVPPGHLLVSDEPCLGAPIFNLTETPGPDPLLLLNARLHILEARLQDLEDARLSARCRRGVRRLQRLWSRLLDQVQQGVSRWRHR
jgi:hypothetical protein